MSEWRPILESFKLPWPVLALDTFADSRFNQGAALDDKLLEKIVWFISHRTTNPQRGHLQCRICQSNVSVRIAGSEYVLGSFEIWVPRIGSDGIYAVSNLLMHYMASHNYVPPYELAQAIRDFDVNSGWLASRELAKYGCEIDEWER